MNLEGRISKLEDRVGITDQTPPLVRIDVADCSKDSKDSEGIPTIIVVPGRLGRIKGTTLFRGKDEDPANFLERCASKHTEFFG